eukprot:5575088-Karenia_brevis.AAC.1
MAVLWTVGNLCPSQSTAAVVDVDADDGQPPFKIGHLPSWTIDPRATGQHVPCQVGHGWCRQHNIQCVEHCVRMLKKALR